MKMTKDITKGMLVLWQRSYSFKRVNQKTLHKHARNSSAVVAKQDCLVFILVPSEKTVYMNVCMGDI